MGGILSIIHKFRNYKNAVPVTKTDDALRVGLLGTARSAPRAIIRTACSHAEVTVHAVASRDRKRADDFAKANGVPVVYAGVTAYQEVIDDPAVDIIYNALPNALHFEWTMKALKAGKHVLLEKPSVCNAEEARVMYTYAEERGLVVLEACHPRFHPAYARFKSLVKDSDFGKIISIHGNFRLSQVIKVDDMRFDYTLGGGTMMDLGSYLTSLMRDVVSFEPIEVTQAHAFPLSTDTSDPDKSKVDLRTVASLALPNEITMSLDADWHKPFLDPFGLFFGMPECDVTIWHSLSVTPNGGETRVEHAYTFGGAPEEQQYWSTYRYQLEAFVDKIRGRFPRTWITKEDSTKNMECIDMIYEKSGLGPRRSTTYFNTAVQEKL